MQESPTAKRRTAFTGRRGAIIATAAVAAACAAVAPIAVQSASGPSAAAPPPAPTSAEPAPGMLTFHSPVGGFALDYPSNWTRAVSSDPQVPIVAHSGPHSFLVRLVGLSEAPQDLATARRLADRFAFSDESVKLLAEPKPITLAGLPGYFYFYTYTDPTTGTSGAHSHLFLFRGSTMLMLVFQASPADTFQDGSGAFDAITQSFRVE